MQLYQFEINKQWFTVLISSNSIWDACFVLCADSLIALLMFEISQIWDELGYSIYTELKWNEQMHWLKDRQIRQNNKKHE